MTTKQLPKKQKPKTDDLEKKAQELIQKDVAVSKSSDEMKRNFKNTKQVYHDLYCLEVSEAQRNISWNDNAVWEKMPHKHFFHTVDSDGRPQKYATSAIGHTHEIIVKGLDEDGKPIIEVGPAIVVSKGKKFNIDEKKMQQHSHDVTYRWSEEFTVREYDQDFIKAVNSKESRMSKANSKPAGLV